MISGIILENTINMAVTFAKKRIDKSILKQRLLELLERQKKENDNCLLNEEIDFSAYCDYICSDFVIASQKFIIGTSRERSQAHDSIISEAQTRAKARTKQAKKRVKQMVFSALKIIKNLSLNHLGKDKLLLAAEIEDRVIEANRAQTDIILNALDQNFKATSSDSTGHISQLIQQGRMDDALREEQLHKRTLDASHELFPHYGFDVKQIDGKDVWVSSPRTPDATLLYPPVFKGECSLKIDGHPIPSGKDPFVHAYNHQKEIEVLFHNAVGYLGNRIDPAQAEAAAFTNQILRIKPPSLPNNLPCKITINDEAIIEYIKLSIDEICDDGSLIVSNRKDPIAAIIISIKESTENQYHLNILRNGNETKNVLRFEQLQYSLLKGGLFKIIRLDTGEIIGQGILRKEDAEEQSNRQKRIEFFQNLLFIEQETQQKFVIPKEITFEDFYVINDLANLLYGKQNKHSFSSAELSFTFNNKLREIILETDDTPKHFVFCGDMEFSVFGSSIIIKASRIFSPVVVDNLPKLKEKAKILDDGDSLRLKIIAPKGVKAYIIDSLPSSEDKNIENSTLHVYDLPTNQATEEYEQ